MLLKSALRLHVIQGMSENRTAIKRFLLLYVMTYGPSCVCVLLLTCRMNENILGNFLYRFQ